MKVSGILLCLTLLFLGNVYGIDDCGCEGRDSLKDWVSCFEGGSGTENDPFLIATADQFLILNQDCYELKSACFKLTYSIDFQQWAHLTNYTDLDPLGRPYIKPVPSFSGVFDGNGNKLTNFALKNVSGNLSNNSLGLFCELNGASIYDLTISNAFLDVDNPDGVSYVDPGNAIWAGIFCGSGAGTFSNITISGSSIDYQNNDAGTPFNVGALGGLVTQSEITGCFIDVDMDVYAKDVQLYDNDGFVGLMAGRLQYSTVGQDVDGKMDCFVGGQLDIALDDCSEPLGGIGVAFGGFDSSQASCLMVGSQEQKVVANITFGDVNSYFGIGGFAGNFTFNSTYDGALVTGCGVYADIHYNQDDYTQAYKYYPTVSIGGFIGVTYSGTDNSIKCTEDCVSYCDIYVTGHANDVGVGGFIGTHASGTIYQSQWCGKVIDLSAMESDQMPTQFEIGGFAGCLMQNDLSGTVPVIDGCSVDFITMQDKALQLDQYIFGDYTIEDFTYDLANYNTPDKYDHQILAFKESYLEGSSDLDHNIGVGGFVGISEGVIRDCEANSIWIEGPVATGGFAGQMHDQQDAEMTKFNGCVSSDIHIIALGKCIGGFIGYARGADDYQTSGFTQIRDEEDYVFYNCTATNIYDIKLVDLTGDANGDIGGFAGMLENVLLTQCCTIACLGIEEKLSGDKLGGVIGHAYNSSLDQCAAIGVLLSDNAPDVGSGYVGGVVGMMIESDLYRSACYTGVYTGPNTSGVGGLAGYAGDSYISSSMTMCSLTPDENCDYFGGLCGEIYGNSTLDNSYVTGNINMVSTKEEILDGLSVVKDVVEMFLPGSKESIAADVKDIIGLTKDIIEFVEIVVTPGERGKVGAVCGYLEGTVYVSDSVYWDSGTVDQAYFANNLINQYSDRGLRSEQIIRYWESRYCDSSNGYAWWYNSTSADTKFLYPVPQWLLSFSDKFNGIVDGDGSDENPYNFDGQPVNPDDGDNNYYYDLSASYMMYGDDTLGFDFPGIGTEETPFTGTFDGQGNTLYIADMDYSNRSSIAGALINYAENATIRNLNVVLCDMNMIDYQMQAFGFIVGQAAGSTVIENCSVRMADDVDHVVPPLCFAVGTIAGKITGNTSITDSTAENITFYNGTANLAGIAALAYDNASIVNCTGQTLLDGNWPYTTAGIALSCFDEVQVINCSQTDSSTLVVNLYGNASIVESESENTSVNDTHQIEQPQCYGGIVCEMFGNSSVINCKVLDPLMIGLYSGGVVGVAHDNASVEGCIMQTKRNFVLNNSPMGCGGIAGKSETNVLISKCITKEQYLSGYSNGGIVGINEGTIADSLVYEFKCSHAQGAFSNGNIAGMHNAGMIFNVVYNNDSDVPQVCGTGGGYEISINAADSSELSQESYFASIGWSIGDDATWVIKRHNALFPILQSHRIAAGDCAGDYFVDMIDFAHVASIWPDYDESLDLDGSGQIDEIDFFIFAENWLGY